MEKKGRDCCAWGQKLRGAGSTPASLAETVPVARNDNKNKKIVVGMSGGVDSSVALILLKKQGFDVVGVSLKYATWDNPCRACRRENVCCTKESFEIAKAVCERYGVEHHILDVSRDFQKEVINYFVRELKNNRTPSPCVFCNSDLKFKKLLEFADKVGAEFVATGHYARVDSLHNLNSSFEGSTLAKKVKLETAKDKTKDQTYSLSFLRQNQLVRLIFPLGELTKDEVYNIAKREGLKLFEKRAQSQDFCFASGASYLNFLKTEIGLKPGKIVDTDGKTLGGHCGLYFYTIGQRKGIGIGGGCAPRSPKGEVGAYFVVGKDAKKNQLIVSKNENDSARREIILKPFNLISDSFLSSLSSRTDGDCPRRGLSPKRGDLVARSIKVLAKTRSRQPLNKATIRKKENALVLTFERPLKSITPGQIAVFYRKNVCLGGGVIV